MIPRFCRAGLGCIFFFFLANFRTIVCKISQRVLPVKFSRESFVIVSPGFQPPPPTRNVILKIHAQNCQHLSKPQTFESVFVCTPIFCSRGRPSIVGKTMDGRLERTTILAMAAKQGHGARQDAELVGDAKASTGASTRKARGANRSSPTERPVQGALKGTNLRGQTEPFSLIFADFCRFSPSPRKQSIWETQIFAENLRFSQETAENRRNAQKTADWRLCP